MSELVLQPVPAREAHHSRPTSLTHDMFFYMFESADLYSAMWQPLLKSAGRWHLEVSGLGMRHSQATLQLTRDLARCWTAGDIMAAHARYWDAVSAQVSESGQRLAATVHNTIAIPAASEVVAMPVKRPHDLIKLPDADEAHTVRKVA
ncbi:MAG: hypothetical protein ABL893_01265 [Hyphomicrobium sp.]|nr:hypothetical protein [Hyphomicrobium sp.]